MGIGSKMILQLVLMQQFGWMLLPTASANQMLCEDVRLQCAFDSACAEALKNYFFMCDKLLKADTKKCPETCLFALVALTTTRHGQRLLDCTCRDSFCEMMKARVEVCRPQVVEATKNETVVPCEMARWVCQVDPECHMALGYHAEYCKSMQEKDMCTERCLNSFGILRRQDKAVMLSKCRCMGQTALECLRHKEHIVRYCFGGSPDGVDRNTTGGNSVKKVRKKHRPDGFDLDPDRFEVELMLKNPMYEPDVQNRQKIFDHDTTPKGSASVVRPPRFAFVIVLQCSMAIVAALLVKQG